LYTLLAQIVIKKAISFFIADITSTMTTVSARLQPFSYVDNSSLLQVKSSAAHPRGGLTVALNFAPSSVPINFNIELTA